MKKMIIKYTDRKYGVDKDDDKDDDSIKLDKDIETKLRRKE